MIRSMKDDTLVRLTSFSHGAGCACKVGPDDLARVMRSFNALPGNVDPALLVGTATGDDAAVYRIDERTAVVFTVDFFTPIVDDAYTWGRIAAANALSDVYAMGGRPLLCLNVTAWPVDQLPAELLARVLEGGASIAAEAGAFVAGGHTIDDREPKYGMAVVGIADPQRLIRNDRAAIGDRLVLTKPLGTGVVSTALKRGDAPAEALDAAVTAMTALNAAASSAALDANVRAGTDVTGFGLLGHLHKMCAASGTAAHVRASAVPVLPHALDLVRAGAVSGGTRRNLAYVEDAVTLDDGVTSEIHTLLADAQTSGGLLLCVAPDEAPALVQRLASEGVDAVDVGAIVAGEPGSIRISSS
jgi:selenide,water dikinase